MRDETSRFWDRQVRQPQPVYWFFHALVRAYVNEQVTGVAWGWPHLFLKSDPQLAYYPRPRGLSIGCGTGNLDRSLRLLRVCDAIDAFDVSPESIAIARETASREGIDGIRFEVEDAESLDLPPQTYDAVFFNHSLHHIADPERLLARVAASLKPGALFYADDYVGPSRAEWQDTSVADRELRAARDAFALVPEDLRLKPIDPPLDLSDPSEMIASDRIDAAIRNNFRVTHYRPYWGNILFPLLNAVDGERVDEDLLRALIDAERAAVFTRPLFAVYYGVRD
jgi:SAM-dependent methyltransferase